mgnify:CR=1 FL=1
MGELNLKQIEDKLNNEFKSDSRKIIFWYDEKKEFIDDVKALKLEGAKVHHLSPNNLFKTKVLLERKDKETNYLIYAPFAKPENRDNHLADIILYSKEFFADRPSLLAVDLGIDTVYKRVLEKYIKFFNAKDRTKRFYDLEVDTYNEETIEIGLLSALTRSRVASFEEVLRLVLSEDLCKNKYMEDFARYDLEEAFWKYCNLSFSYKNKEPSLIKLSMSLLLTYAKNQMGKDLPPSLNTYILNKAGTVMAFVDHMMNSSIYQDSFRSLSNEVYRAIDGQGMFKEYGIEDLIDVDVFKGIDRYIINWILDRLLDENLNVEVNGLSIAEICKSRKFKHFKDLYKDEYDLLINGYHLISHKDIKIEGNIKDLVAEYDKKYYRIDSYYRNFYYHLDKVEDNSIYEDLEVLVENIYINRYLDRISREFTSKLDYNSLRHSYKLQKDFYNNFIAGRNERIIVIISDALRYEIGKELVESFKYNEKIEAKIQPQIGILPSYTSLGMAALLPHEKIEIDDNYSVYIDGKASQTLIDRRNILQDRNPNSDCIQYDDLVKMKKEEMRKFFTGKEVIYIYHNQIDARGDKLNTEDEVFLACKEAMGEIEDIIRRLTNNISATNFIVTADHGFIYTRSKNKEADKIDRFFNKDDKINKRFIISDNNYDVLGTKNMMVSDVLGNYDGRTITLPLTSNIFKAQGGGQNYVHGGSSPQELIVPVIHIKTIMGAVDVEDVKISLISMISRINSLILSLDFVQQEPVSDTIKAATYRLRFVDKLGSLISNEEIYVAKSKSKDSSDRIFNLRFNLRNKKYYRDEEYYFTIVNMETGMEVYRQQVIIDIAFADDFGFDI